MICWNFAFFKKNLLVNDSPDNQVQNNSFINPHFILIVLIRELLHSCILLEGSSRSGEILKIFILIRI
jgi:hypothetical protein